MTTTNKPAETDARITADGSDLPTVGTPPDELTTDRLSVLVISERGVTTRPLPGAGQVRLGRSPQSDLVIDDTSISRNHAVLSIGPPITVHDLGSANGTRVRDTPVRGEPVELAPGDVIQLGSATLILQRRAAPLRTHRLWAHDYFEVRVAEECDRAQRGTRSFAVARLSCSPRPPAEALQTILLAEARASDVVGEYGPNEYEVLLLDLALDRASGVVGRIAEHLKRRGVQVQVGLACFPVDGRTADELLQRASPLPRVTAPSADAAITSAIVGDRRMHDLYRLVERIAAGNITVLILGETGVGKEVLAQRVHSSSPRCDGPYLRLNCAALTETLLESELFGHERGAFTGAVQAKPGLLETAVGGSVFLDEIGELPLSTQVKLLRVLEERSVLRVGGLKARPLDVRFIAATNRDLEAECARGAFRQDLYFRLDGATLVIPPLRERVSEIESLARAFAGHAAAQLGQPTAPSLSADALDALRGYAWPGNIRELRNVIERAVLLCGTGPVLPGHLPLEKMRVTIGVPAPAAAPGSAPVRPQSQAAGSPRAAVVRAADRADPAGGGDGEKARILAALDECAGNQTAAARALGIGRRTLIKRLDLYGIKRPRKR